MLNKLEIAKEIRKFGDYYNCPSANAGTCFKCPFNGRPKSYSPSCISNARKYLEQRNKKIQQWKNINAK